jgi:hypothetical protein
MKFSPPGSETYMIVNRFDGFVGHDVSCMPNSVAERICAAWPALGPRTEVDRIRARMVARQLIYQRRKKVVTVLRQRFGLLTR